MNSGLSVNKQSALCAPELENQLSDQLAKILAEVPAFAGSEKIRHDGVADLGFDFSVGVHSPHALAARRAYELVQSFLSACQATP